MTQKSILVFVFCFLGSSFGSCFWPCDPVPEHFEITGIESEFLTYHYSSKYQWQTADVSEKVRWNEYFIRLLFDVEYIAQSNSSFGGSAFALSCRERGSGGDLVGVDTLYVRTIDDYNANFKAGSFMNTILLASTDYFRDLYDLDSFLPLSNYLVENNNGIREEFLNLKFDEVPDKEGAYSFEIIFILNNGLEFRHITSPIILQP